MKYTKKLISSALALLLASSLFAGCGAASTSTSSNNSGSGAKKIKIGFEMDTLKEERWQKDRDLFKAKVESLGATVDVQCAYSDDQLQIKQAESLISEGVNVLVVIPHDAAVCAAIVDKAAAANIPVISYDRLITNTDKLGLYISFDNEKVGELQAQEIVKLKPTGNYAYIGGSPTDNNAVLCQQGAMKVLQPLIDKGDIKLVYNQMTTDWKPEVAQANLQDALAKNNNKIDAVIAANDGTAGGVVAALKAHGLAGKVPVSGQDAELAACQRIISGTQTLTIYKPVRLLAETAAQVAVDWANGKKPSTTKTVNNGKIDVPSILLDPTSVDKTNMDSTVIADGWQKKEDVYH